MTTALKKTVSRETVRTRDAGRSLIVSLEPGDVLAFRLKGCRRTFRTTLSARYCMAVKQELKDARRRKPAGRRKP